MLKQLSLDKELISSVAGRLDDSTDFALKAPRSISQLEGGRNSRVYLVKSYGGSQYVAKRYFRHNNDSRDRLATEYQSLGFMWKHGLRCIPRPLAVDPDNNLAFYEYIPGRALKASDISTNDIFALADFLYRLHELKDKEDSRSLPPASEACFSAKAALDNLRIRRERLATMEEHTPLHALVKSLLEKEFHPLLDDVQTWLERELPSVGLTVEAEIPRSERTLSPSDYGFHNALRRSDGRLVFLDFEYFGWDDPVKMILDFLLHPAVELSRELKKFFLRRILDILDGSGGLARRIGYYQVLYGLKWVLILLNEFLNSDFDRRRFAAIEKMERNSVLSIQLEKARRQLEWARGVYGKTDLVI